MQKTGSKISCFDDRNGNSCNLFVCCVTIFSVPSSELSCLFTVGFHRLIAAFYFCLSRVHLLGRISWMTAGRMVWRVEGTELILINYAFGGVKLVLMEVT